MFLYLYALYRHVYVTKYACGAFLLRKCVTCGMINMYMFAYEYVLAQTDCLHVSEIPHYPTDPQGTRAYGRPPHNQTSPVRHILFNIIHTCCRGPPEDRFNMHYLRFNLTCITLDLGHLALNDGRSFDLRFYLTRIALGFTQQAFP